VFHGAVRRVDERLCGVWVGVSLRWVGVSLRWVGVSLRWVVYCVSVCGGVGDLCRNGFSKDETQDTKSFFVFFCFICEPRETSGGVPRDRLESVCVCVCVCLCVCARAATRTHSRTRARAHSADAVR
jgi:hypothetical protein